MAPPPVTKRVRRQKGSSQVAPPTFVAQRMPFVTPGSEALQDVRGVARLGRVGDYVASSVGAPTISEGSSIVSSLGTGVQDHCQGLEVVVRGGNELNETSIHGKTISIYARNHLFRKKKFILNESEMEFSATDGMSICFQCLMKLNMVVEKSQQFWEDHKHIVVREINNKRSNVAYAMQKEFFGK
jgi:hypothetical protein